MSSDGVHGPRQLLRAATLPICAVRQSRTRDGALARSVCIADATAGSLAVLGSKMNARSLRAPSPLMSPPTIGVNGAPEVRRAFAVSSSHDVTGCVTYPWIAWRMSMSPGDHSLTFGLPAVV